MQTASPAPHATPAGHAVDIDRLEVSDQWKTFFKAVRDAGGLELTHHKALPKTERKPLTPPPLALLGAFFFGFFYYLYKGMWKKGLVLLGILLPCLVVVATVLSLVGADLLVNLLGFAGGLVFAFMAPRDFYAVKVLRDDGWLPVKPVL